MMFYQQILLARAESKLREEVEKKVEKEWRREGKTYNEDSLNRKVTLVLDEEKREKANDPLSPYGRVMQEATRLSSADKIVETGEVESTKASGYGLGKATCGTCNKEKRDEEPTLGPKESKNNKAGWRVGSSKKHGVPKTFFCSQGCFDKFDWNNYNPDRSPNSSCSFCQQQYRQGGVYFPDNPGMVFCSVNCARNWEREIWSKKSLAKQRADFISERLETMEGWNLLTDEEKQNFINQVNNSEFKQFQNIYQQATNLINEKQGIDERERNRREKNKKNGLRDIPRNDHGPHNIPNQNESQEKGDKIPGLSLLQSQAKAKEEIEKNLKDSGISAQELEQKSNLLGKTNWKDYLKKLDSTEKVAEFVNNLKQEILKLKLSKQKSISNGKDKNPKNKWVLPAIILVLSFLALTSLVLIIRKRKQRGF